MIKSLLVNNLLKMTVTSLATIAVSAVLMAVLEDDDVDEQQEKSELELLPEGENEQ